MIEPVYRAYEAEFLSALAVTVLVEASVVVLSLRIKFFYNRRKSVSWSQSIAAGILPSVATLPYLWFVLPAFVATYLRRTIIGEIGIMVVELMILRFLTGLPWRKSALLSIAANIASVAVGLLIF